MYNSNVPCIALSIENERKEKDLVTLSLTCALAAAVRAPSPRAPGGGWGVHDVYHVTPQPHENVRPSSHKVRTSYILGVASAGGLV